MPNSQSREALRGAALSALGTLAEVRSRVSAISRTPRVQFLYLHHVFPHEEESWRALLGALVKTYRFISYSEAVDRVWRGDFDDVYLSLSFDDGFRSCLGAARAMEEFGITGCFFVCGEMLEKRDLAGRSAFSARLHRPPMEYLAWDDLDTLLANGHEIGGHTLTHRNLSQMPETEIEEEIGGCYDLLARHIGPVRHFSWPFGRFAHFSPGAARAVYAAGYASCASAERGCHTVAASGADLCIRRDLIFAEAPVSHVRYFIERSVRSGFRHAGHWPRGWREAMGGVPCESLF